MFVILKTFKCWCDFIFRVEFLLDEGSMKSTGTLVLAEGLHVD